MYSNSGPKLIKGTQLTGVLTYAHTPEHKYCLTSGDRARKIGDDSQATAIVKLLKENKIDAGYAGGVPAIKDESQVDLAIEIIKREYPQLF